MVCAPQAPTVVAAQGGGRSSCVLVPVDFGTLHRSPCASLTARAVASTAALTARWTPGRAAVSARMATQAIAAMLFLCVQPMVLLALRYLLV